MAHRLLGGSGEQLDQLLLSFRVDSEHVYEDDGLVIHRAISEMGVTGEVSGPSIWLVCAEGDRRLAGAGSFAGLAPKWSQLRRPRGRRGSAQEAPPACPSRPCRRSTPFPRCRGAPTDSAW